MTLQKYPAPRIKYIFRAGRRARLDESSAAPTEFFYGYQQLQAQGIDVSLAEDSELGMAPPLPAFARLINKLSFFLGGLPVGMLLSFFLASGDRKLADSDSVVATTNGMGLALAMAKAMGRVQVPVLLLAMGLLPMRLSRIQKVLYPLILRHLHLVTISRGEQAFLRRLLPKQDIHYLPFGVDHRFWTPADNPTGGDYVLAIGNDQHRDWQTLVDAWHPNLPPLKIVTSLPVPQAAANVEVVRGDWRRQIISDEAIRDLYRASRFVVIPLSETTQPAGQSACLQAMACGKAVILSDISGLWDRGLMRDGETVLLTPPGDGAALLERVHFLADDLSLAARIGAAGRSVIESSLNVDMMAAALLRLLEGT